jgi:hypothetical protein
VSPKRGDRVSVPPLSGWNVVFGTSEAASGWEELCRVALPNTHRCLNALKEDPRSHADWDRQHQLRGKLAQREWAGRMCDQWEYEVTSGGRVRYLIDDAKQTVVLVYASPRHPKDTE